MEEETRSADGAISCPETDKVGGRRLSKEIVAISN